MRSVFDDCSLSVIVRRTQGSNGFRDGEFEGKHAMITAKTVPRDNTIKVILGSLQRMVIPVQFLDPLPVTLPHCQAVVTNGAFCGQIVKVIGIEGDIATVKHTDRSTTQINVIHLCKFSLRK